jgi:hypothetical protein
MENKKDNDSKRATFNVPYPDISSVIYFKEKEDFKTSINKVLSGQKIVFKYTRANLEACTFSECQFFVESETDHIICKLTFRNCDFRFCFFGSVIYRGVRFEGVKFINCDFSNSVFDSCVFDNCTFESCSAYHPEFINTEINPGEFLPGIRLLKENYTDITSKISDDFIYMKFNLCKKIYHSNNCIGNHFFSDVGLYELKKTELKYLKFKIRRAFEMKSCIEGLKSSFYLPFKWLNIKTTKGGTSLARLLLCIFVLLLMFNLYFFISGICEPNYNFALSNNSFIKFFQWLPKTISIFLSYGYTAFKDNSGFNFFMINVCSLLGIIFYAMVISILIRKIYK